MSEVRLETLPIELAPLGPVNPLPPIAPMPDVHEDLDVTAADEEMKRNIGYGRVPSIAPYLLQDGYTRTRRPGELKTAVVENDVLRATFALDVGGRLWSLVHKPSGRELLYRNPVLQPANLALRNAWVAGGVEWNIGTIGHGPTTSAPLHAARVIRPDGTPVLRMYEFERLRRVVFQIDAYLPDGAQTLTVHVRITNPRDVEVPLYWWSNIAVPEADDVRVVVPAMHAWKVDYSQAVSRVGVPVNGGGDLTYTTRSEAAADYFFEIPDGQRRWITALDGGGSGLVQTSTDLLRGRKLFLWGQGPGSAHWQDWLSPGGGSRYLEIQAGLARTQLEHMPMPARASWSWVEAYGLLQVDGSVVHGDDWAAARAVVAEGLERLVPRQSLSDELAAAAAWADAEPSEILHEGSGWGALERRLRQAWGDTSLSLPGTPFGDSTLTDEQAPWIELLDRGRMTPGDPADPPVSYQAGEPWRRQLEPAEGWLAKLHLGVALCLDGETAAARKAWQDSLAEQPSAWAQRNLAVLDRVGGGDHQSAADRYLLAVAEAPACTPLVVEALDALLAAGRAGDALDLAERLPEQQRTHGRVQLAEVRALLATEQLERAGTLLQNGIEVPDVREGELVLEQVWFDYVERLAARDLGSGLDDERRRRLRTEHPLPARYDFRMKPTG